MINRPSYAQRTLEVTRSSLQRMPSSLSPAVSGIIVARPQVDAGDFAAACSAQTASSCHRIGGLVSLRRWRRKGVDPRMAVR